MNKNLELSELAIVIAVSNYDPTLLNPSFLTGTGIIPTDWELARQPVLDNRASQVIFNNGISLVAQANRLMFVKAIGPDSEPDTDLSEIVGRYVETLPHLDYQAVGINLRSYISLASEESGARNYLFKTLFVLGSWQDCGTEPVKAGSNLLFTFDSKRLNLSINEAALQLPDSEQIPVVLFSGNFDYELKQDTIPKRLEQLQEIVRNWHSDQDTYTRVVNRFTDNPTEIIFPVPALVV